MYRIETNRGVFYYDQTRNQLVREKDKGNLCPNPARFEDQETRFEKYGKDFNGNILDPRKIQTLEISLGLKCNYECRHCFQAEERKNGDYAEGTPEMVDPFVEKLRKFDFRNLKKIDIWGGEPLVYWKTLQKLIPRLRSLFPTVCIRMVTNGSLLNKEIIDFLVIYNVRTEISMDGLKNDLRIRSVDSDNFENLKRAFSFDNFYAKPTITPSNCNVEECIENIRERFNRNIPVICRGIVRGTDERNSKLSKFSEEQLETLRKSVYDAGIYHIHNSLHTDIVKYKRMIDNGETPYDSTGVCKTPVGLQMMVNMKGEVLRCHQNCGSGEVIGTLDNIFDMKHHPIGFYSWSERPNCYRCIHVGACGGGCPRQDPENHENYCEARKAYYDGIMRLYFKFYHDAEVLSVEEV